MKFILIVIVAGLAFLGFYALNKKDSDLGSDRFQPIQHPAPANLLEYPPQNSKNHGEGLYSQVVSPPTNNLPLRGYDIVHLNYKLWNSKGQNVDSSDRHNHPMKLRVDGGGKTNSVIKGWSRIIPDLKEGETRRVWIPEKLAYPNSPNEATRGTLVFDITVSQVDRPNPTPQFDQFPTEPPANKLQLKSGLVALKTKSSKSTVTPKMDDIVEIQLNLWDTKGQLYDSTEKLGRQRQIALSHTIAGLRQAISMMKVGESYRFWIPAHLAYGENPPTNFPKGPIVCDIELLNISQPLEDFSSPRIKNKPTNTP